MLTKLGGGGGEAKQNRSSDSISIVWEQKLLLSDPSYYKKFLLHKTRAKIAIEINIVRIFITDVIKILTICAEVPMDIWHIKGGGGKFTLS